MARKRIPTEADLPTSSSEEGTGRFGVEPEPGQSTRIPWPAPGAILKERFVLQQCLAEGTTSRLYRARDSRLVAADDPAPWVVLKVVTALPGSEPRALQALRREAAIGQGLEHPNLLRILGIDHDGLHNFLWMAWVEGESLGTILDSRGTRPMTRVQAMHIIEGVCRALTYLHGHGITHADVKPANILVTAEGSAALLDFGVALGPGAGNLPAIRGFTPEYASPEVLAGAEPTPADDLFAVACVAYRMLSGYRPFGPGTARDAEAAGTRPTCPENLSPAQWRALDRALACRRAERQPDVATLLSQLKGARDEVAALSDRSAGEPWVSLPPAVSPPRQPGFLWPAAVGALVSLLAVGAVYLWLDTTDRPAPAPAPAETPEVAETAATEEGPAIEAAASTVDPVLTELMAPATAQADASLRAALPPPAPQPSSRPAAPPAARSRPGSASTTRPLLVATAADGRDTTGSRAGEAAVPATPESPAASAEDRQESARDGGLADTTGTAPTVPLSSLAVRRYVEPEFPRRAAARRVEGWVDVTFTVDDSGRTRDVQVKNADPPGVFDEAALSAVRRWTFERGGVGAVTGPVRSGVRLRFDPRKTRRSR